LWGQMALIQSGLIVSVSKVLYADLEDANRDPVRA
jgi:hypothetical protein